MGERLDRDHRVDAAAEGDEDAGGVEGRSIAVGLASALDEDVVERQLVAEGELAETLSQRRLEEGAAARTHRDLAEVHPTRGPGLVVGEARQEVPELGHGHQRGAAQSVDPLEDDLLAEVSPVELVVPSQGGVRHLETTEAEPVGAHHLGPPISRAS